MASHPYPPPEAQAPVAELFLPAVPPTRQRPHRLRHLALFLLAAGALAVAGRALAGLP